ncbi:hypothetical protein EBU95_03790 [bacterium]|nr:hypothetical protein [bacterium]
MSSQTEAMLKLEESVFEARAKITVLEGKLASLQASMQSPQGKDEALEKKVDTIASNAQKALKTLLEQNMALEQSVISLGKLITAFTKVLVNHGLINDKEVMAELRSLDEANEKEKIESLKSSGLLQQAESVSEESLVILKHEVESESGKSLVSSYRPVQVSDLPKEDDARSKILGLKVGESFKRESAEKEMSEFTVLEVYNYKKESELKQ